MRREALTLAGGDWALTHEQTTNVISGSGAEYGSSGTTTSRVER